MTKALTLESLEVAIGEMKAENERRLSCGEMPLFIRPTHVLWPIASEEADEKEPMMQPD